MVPPPLKGFLNSIVIREFELDVVFGLLLLVVFGVGLLVVFCAKTNKGEIQTKTTIKRVSIFKKFLNMTN